MSEPSSDNPAQMPVDVVAQQTTAGEFEAVIRGLRPLPAQPWQESPTAGAVPLAEVLGALVRSVCDAQLTTDIAAAKAMAAAAASPVSTEDCPNGTAAWADGVLPSFYQIAELTVDLTLDVRFAPVGPPEATALSVLVANPTGAAETSGQVGAPVRVVLRQVPPPAAVLANLPAPQRTDAPPIHVD
jgi:hypothetical protein